MKNTIGRWLTVAVSFAAPLAQAHPGPGGPDAFDLGFAHLADYPRTTMLCLAVLATGGWVIWEYVSSRRSGQPCKARRIDRRE